VIILSQGLSGFFLKWIFPTIYEKTPKVSKERKVRMENTAIKVLLLIEKLLKNFCFSKSESITLHLSLIIV